jgi:hypothetical protein
MTDRFLLDTELTPIGEQTLVPGVRRVTMRDRLELLMNMPSLPRRSQRPCDHGLFDLGARNQLDLLDLLKGPSGANPSSPSRKES